VPVTRAILIAGLAAGCCPTARASGNGGSTGHTAASPSTGSAGTSGHGSTTVSGAAASGTMASSTGSTTGEVSMDGGCSTLPGIADNEFAGCTGNGDCGCPLVCVHDVLLDAGLCERPCMTLNDCPSFYSTCNGQTCIPVPCRSFDAVCAFGDGGGDCVPFGPAAGFGFDWPTVGLCSQGGTLAAGQACTSNQTRPPSTALCVAGTLCGPTASAGSICGDICDPDDPDSCSDAGGTCVAFEANEPRLGICSTGSIGFGDSGPVCSPLGGRCVFYTDCCSLACAAPQHITDPVCCQPAGAPCVMNAECWSLDCNDGGTGNCE
jgi:hypothetical protein